MKGVILSLALFIIYVLATAMVSHIVRFERHSRLFLPAAAIFTPLYFALYALTPPTIWFLSPRWMATYGTADAIYGYVVLLLNIHSYMDFFFGFNGGFSTSLMVRLMRAGPAGLRMDEIIGCYKLADGRDKLFAWRIPRLEETGYLTIDPTTGRCVLTPKGRLVARAGVFCKRLLGLGKGG